MDNHSKGTGFKKWDAWNKLACAILGLTGAVTLWLLGTVISLNMLPGHYLAIVIVLVVLFLFGIGKALFVTGFGGEDTKKKKNKKSQGSVVAVRMLGLILALALVLVDAAGISMISKLRGTLTDIGNADEEIAYEVVGVYVLADDRAEELVDIKSYDFGYSLSYDEESIKTAMERMEKTIDKKLDWSKFDSDVEAVEGLLAEDVEAILLNTAYISVLEGQEEYWDIASRLKLIHEFKMEDKDVTVLNTDTKPEDMTKEPFIVYVSGNDSDYTSKNQRSDVNILAVVNPVSKQVLLINTPRDYYVELVGSGKGDGQLDKLTHCGNFGVECSMLTLGELYNQDIHYYARINFKGFTKMIDAVGGVTVYSELEYYTPTGTLIKKGDNYMNGTTALEFVRERYAFEDGDNARGRHQMAVIKAIIKKAASGAIITRYGDILDAMGSSFSTNLTNDDMSNLVKMQLNDMATWNIQTFSVMGEGNGAKEYTYSIPNQKTFVWHQDETYVEHAQDLIDKVFDGETITAEDLVVSTGENE